VLLHGEANINDTIVISGAPRSGTTWLMEILETLPKYRSIFEPLHPRWYPEVLSLKLFPPYSPYMPLRAENPSLQEYLEKVLKGKVVSKRPIKLSINMLYKKLVSSKIIVKFIRANKLLHWMNSRFKVKGIYLIIRHPCATIASQLRSGIHPLDTWSINDVKQHILKLITIAEEFRDKESLLRKLGEISRIEEILAALWAINYYIPFYHRYYNSLNYYHVIYEKLILDGEAELKNIFQYIDEEVPPNAYYMLKKPSEMASKDLVKDFQNQLNRWKRHLSREQIDNIIRIVNIFDLNFYDYSLEPDYKNLKNWKPK
jgi:hypothetical protein